MNRHEGEGSQDRSNEVAGEVRGSFRSVLLGWTDPVSGERLTVRMRGEDGLLGSLAPLGFEVLDGEAGAEPGGGGRVLSFRAQRGAPARAPRSTRSLSSTRSPFSPESEPRAGTPLTGHGPGGSAAAG